MRSMSERAPHVLLSDMIKAIERVLSYTEGATFDSFMGDSRTVDAVLRNLQILGEAARRVPRDVEAMAPEIEWAKIVRSRHILVHDYFGVDHEIVWRIVEVHLPPMLTPLRALQADLTPPS